MKFSMYKCVVLCVLSGTMLLSGCGQKGPLYLPQPPAKQQRASK